MDAQNWPFQNVSVDDIGGLVVIDWAHHEIHDGDAFVFRENFSLNNGGTRDYLLTTGATLNAHIVYEVDAIYKFKNELFESGDRVGTNAKTAINRDRNSARAATLTLKEGTSGGTTDGTSLGAYETGGGSGGGKFGGETRSEEEMILKRNAKYIVRLTSGADNNLMNIKLSWYEAEVP